MFRKYWSCEFSRKIGHQFLKVTKCQIVVPWDIKCLSCSKLLHSPRNQYYLTHFTTDQNAFYYHPYYNLQYNSIICHFLLEQDWCNNKLLDMKLRCFLNNLDSLVPHFQSQNAPVGHVNISISASLLFGRSSVVLNSKFQILKPGHDTVLTWSKGRMGTYLRTSHFPPFWRTELPSSPCSVCPAIWH